MLQSDRGIPIREFTQSSRDFGFTAPLLTVLRFLQPDIKSLQIQLTGFLDKDTAPFCKELWNLCLSAQTSSQGVPKELLEAKKMELIQEKASRVRPTERGSSY